MGASVLQNAMIFLGAALVFVPIAKKLGIGSVLGYIIGGVVIGPFVLGFIGTEGEDIMHAAEFGVVMMLFLIGLELNPQSFWRMRRRIIGMGGMQMLFTSVLFFLFFYFGSKMELNTSVALALTFSMSSTAIVLQTLKEKNLDKSQAGKSSFAVLLFQDIAVIPILAALPLLVLDEVPVKVARSGFLGWMDEYRTLTILGAVTSIILLGRFVFSPLLHLIARIHMRELFTASALFLVIAVSWLMDLAGVSAALGAFMAGVLMANSEFRHELESNLEPFKGLLLGLFFTAVGSTINFGLIVHQPMAIFQTVVLFMVLKSFVLFLVGKIFKKVLLQNILFTLLLSQIGEFAFILMGSIGVLGLLNKESLDFYMAVITISMIMSPILLFVNEKFIASRLIANTAEEKEYKVDPKEHNDIIIAGFGHFGSTLGRFLRANGVEATILDNNSDQVLLLRKMGFKVFYGDATRTAILDAAGAAHAKILVSALDIPEKNIELSAIVSKHYPHLKLFFRAKNRMNAYELIDNGVNNIYRESIHASVYMGVDILSVLGFRKYTSLRKANDFILHDNTALQKLSKHRHDYDSYVKNVREEIEQQERLLAEDRKFVEHKPDNAWDKSKLVAND
ncbi:monovalent cation:proton antiporter-2 (CPA2) family protein [Sediminibacterium sp. TEGAF015]|uniref:monovalent cation:proton antiporter-2 (CPA2) family protein n=1 Tax=Sediminibacterium sp. TEGAF015 TaxID=575378 RepID=UPI0021FCB3C5|nr:monovalent cation:proton antiporter-2 (CPA2) family protein [Sediminibacterium sp. TEGAF015]BDQ11033.1 potassium transporter [Sediminibacterium sp. TEGAF015]